MELIIGARSIPPFRADVSRPPRASSRESRASTVFPRDNRIDDRSAGARGARSGYPESNAFTSLKSSAVSRHVNRYASSSASMPWRSFTALRVNVGRVELGYRHPVPAYPHDLVGHHDAILAPNHGGNPLEAVGAHLGPDLHDLLEKRALLRGPGALGRLSGRTRASPGEGTGEEQNHFGSGSHGLKCRFPQSRGKVNPGVPRGRCF